MSHHSHNNARRICVSTRSIHEQMISETKPICLVSLHHCFWIKKPMLERNCQSEEQFYLRQVCWFEACKVGEQNPVPTCHHNIFRFNITMAYLQVIKLSSWYKPNKKYHIVTLLFFQSCWKNRNTNVIYSAVTTGFLEEKMNVCINY